jgi:hypothetical protein
MKVRFQQTTEDRERYGGDEWIHIDTNQLPSLGYDRLAELERDMKHYDDTSLARILSVEWSTTSMLGMRGVLWLARQTSGLDKPAWNDYKPDVLGTYFVIDRGGDQADPPAGGSSEPPSEKTAPAKTTRSKKD